MGNDKSILEKITGTVKEIANIAAEAANQALKPDEPPRKAEKKSGVAYMPLAAEGLVSDPFMVPPIAVAPIPRRRRVAPKPAAKRANKTAGKTVRKSLRKAAKKSVARRSGKAAQKSAAKAGRRVAKKRGKKAHTRGRA
jgi:hypothetical protein